MQVRARQVADKAACRRADIQLGVEERQRLEEEQQEVARLEASARSEAHRSALKQRLDMDAKVHSPVLGGHWLTCFWTHAGHGGAVQSTCIQLSVR
jgi:hypothetical protein